VNNHWLPAWSPVAVDGTELEPGRQRGPDRFYTKEVLVFVMSEPDNGVKSVRTMFRIVEFLAEADGCGVTAIANELDLAKSTVHQQLSTLRDLGYAVKEDGTYHVGLRFLSVGEQARGRKETYQLARPIVDQLVEETDERAQFLVEEHGRAIYLHTQEGEHGVKADRHPGKIRHMHSSAGGKAMLAEMSRNRVEAIVEEWGLPAETTETITARDELFDELDAISEQGYAINEEESIDGLWSIGVPVSAHDDVVGALSVSGPRYRMESEGVQSELADLLRGTANELEIKLEYS
jgi:DNA-binding IclR family transcriptional regulator